MRCILGLLLLRVEGSGLRTNGLIASTPVFWKKVGALDTGADPIQLPQATVQGAISRLAWGNLKALILDPIGFKMGKPLTNPTALLLDPSRFKTLLGARALH